jgi:hypothetical protein
MRLHLWLLTLAIVALGQTAVAQTVAVDDAVTPAKREPPVWRRDVRPFVGPLPERRSPPRNATFPTVAGTLLGAFLVGAGAATVGQHQVEQRAQYSDSHGPDFTAIGYGAAGVVVGAVVGGVVGYLLGKLSF